MRLLVLSGLFLAFIAAGHGLGYHQDVGVPEAARIRAKEAREVSSRIIGGMPSQYGDNPYLAGLLITLSTGQMSVCSGTLLSKNKVLTAGQCWYDGYSQGRNVQVVLGSIKLFFGSRYDVSGIAVHPGFNPRKKINDLAMLTLRWSINFYSHVQPALLPPRGLNSTFQGVFGKVSGFGKTSDWSAVGPETVQNAVSVAVSGSNWYDCWYQLPQRPPSSTENLICTSGDNGWGACGGDLGGPLVIEDYYNLTSSYNGSALLIGVTSLMSPFGCQTGLATGYTRVTSFLDWIQRNM